MQGKVLGTQNLSLVFGHEKIVDFVDHCVGGSDKRGLEGCLRGRDRQKHTVSLLSVAVSP